MCSFGQQENRSLRRFFGGAITFITPPPGLNLLLCSQLFDVLKRSNPDNLKKIIPLLGDCRELGLGLSPSDRQMIEEKVSVVFHCAATINFDDTLKNSVIMNVRGTREVMLLARNMKQLKVCRITRNKYNGRYMNPPSFYSQNNVALK
jgi:fatty acyl-CoA reductase